MMPEKDNYQELEDWVEGTEQTFIKKKKGVFKQMREKAKATLGTKKVQRVGRDETSERESEGGSVSLDGPTKEELQQRANDKKGVGLDEKTNQEKYAKHLKKGEELDREVKLEQETPEKDKRGNVNLDEGGVDDPSLVPWTIYHITLPAKSLNSWSKFVFEQDLVFPISLTLENAIYKKLMKDANWVAKITTSAEQEGTAFIADVKQLLGAGGKEPTFESLEEKLEPRIRKLEAQVTQIILSYKQTKEELRRFQGKVGASVGWNVAKTTFHIGHSAATMGATAPVGFVLASKNIAAAIQDIAKVASNPGTVAVEINAGFKAIEEVRKKGVVGTNLMQVAVTGFSVIGNKTLPLNMKDLKKKIEVDHKMAIASLVTAQHKVGKLLAMDAELEQLYHNEIETHNEEKFNKVKRTFPALMKKQREGLQALSNSYGSRIEKHNHWNQLYLQKLNDLGKDNWEYSKDLAEAGEKVESGFDIYEYFSAGIETISELLG
jgi:hypothetical protein